MQQYRTLEGLRLENTWATIGSFDGIHRGHQELIKQMVASAHSSGNLAVVVTFYPHPVVLLRGIKDPYYLTSPEERAELLNRLGVDVIITLQFDRLLADQPAELFMTMLSNHLGLKQLWVGSDFALGKGRQGTVPILHDIGINLGFTVRIVEPVQTDEERISSRQIRSLIVAGQVRKAAEMLGRGYSISGEVIHGDGRGKELGFPTANLQVWPQRLLPANGIYATWVIRKNERFPSVTNVGIRPTFDTKAAIPRVEAHILDFTQEIYREEIRVEFVEFFRTEIRFSSIKDLLDQIHIDVEQAHEVLSHDSRPPDLFARSPKAES